MSRASSRKPSSKAIPAVIPVTRRYRDVGLLFGLLILIRFGWMWWLGRTLYFGDNYSLLIPGKIFTAQWLSQGILPLWNPFIFNGISWAGDISQSLLYPSTLLFLWLPAGWALNLTVALSLGVAMLGMYGLAFSWTKHHAASLIAAVLWALSTQVTGSINNLSTIQSIVWLPWLVWVGLSLGKKWWAVPAFALILTFQVVSGYPQHVVYGVLLAVVFSAYTAWGKLRATTWLKAWVMAGVAGVGLSAVAWLPFAETLLQSTRMLQSTAQASRGSLHPAMLLKIFLPYVFDKPTAGMKWGPAWSGQPNVVLYVTWLGLLAITWGSLQSIRVWRKVGWRTWLKDDLQRNRVFFALILIGCFVFALGSYLPGFSLLQETMPFFRISRYPSITLVLANLVIALWIAMELPLVHLTTKLRNILIGFCVGVMALGFVGWLVTQQAFPTVWHQFNEIIGGRLAASVFHTLERDQVIASVISLNLVAVAGLAAVALWALSKKQWRLLVIAISLDLLMSTQGMLFFAPGNVYPDLQALKAPFAELENPQVRVMVRNFNKPYTDFGSYWEAMTVRVPFSDSFVDRYELITGQHAQRLRDGLTPDWNMVAGIPAVQGYTTLVPQDYIERWQPENAEVGINFVDNIPVPNPLLSQWAARYYLVDTSFAIQEDLTDLPLVASNQAWQLYELPALTRFRFNTDQPVSLLQFEEQPNRILLEFSATASQSALRVADRYDQDWRATVNGQAVQIENHDGMRQIPISEGENTVIMEYAPRWWQRGAALSVLTALALFGYCGWQLHQGRKAG